MAVGAALRAPPRTPPSILQVLYLLRVQGRGSFSKATHMVEAGDRQTPIPAFPPDSISLARLHFTPSFPPPALLTDRDLSSADMEATCLLWTPLSDPWNKPLIPPVFLLLPNQEPLKAWNSVYPLHKDRKSSTDRSVVETLSDHYIIIHP